MAPRKKAEVKVAEHPFADRVDREPSASTKLFVEWLKENTGFEVDVTSVVLARSLVGEFQRSELNQERIRSAREAKASAKANGGTKKAKAAKAAPAKKATGRKRAAAKVDPEEPTPPPAKTATAARRRRRPAAPPE
jgi:hypothetical protein